MCVYNFVPRGASRKKSYIFSVHGARVCDVLLYHSRLEYL